MNDAALIAPVIMFSAVLVITLVLRHKAAEEKNGDKPVFDRGTSNRRQADKIPPRR